MTPAPVIELRDASKSYPGGIQALRGVNLTVEEGGLLAVVGPSGSGKSTMLHVLGTLDKPTTGTVRVAGSDGHPTTVFERSTDASVEDVRAVLARTISPGNEAGVKVSRPSGAPAAKAATDEGLTTLMLGLGAVALLVGGVGVANTVVISILERRQEIGLRRSPGATRNAIRLQFLTGSLLLSGLGGAAGALPGAAATYGFAHVQGWTAVVPLRSLAGGLAATLPIGVAAGLYPAIRASRRHPTVALNAT